MKRREFITLLGGAAAACPLAARAQQLKRLGVLSGAAASTAAGQKNLTDFVQGLQRLGWIDGENIRIEVRWSAADPRLIEAYASDLVGLFKPDVLLSATTANLAALQRATRSIPIVFVEVSDPVAQGFVPNLNRPGGNITGFANPEFSIGGKWVDLLKQMAPSIVQVAFVYNLETSPQSALFATAAEAAAPSLGVQVVRAAVDSTAELEATLERFARLPNAGLVFPIGLFTTLRTKLIVETVARYRLPAIYAAESFMAEGGLMYYFNDLSESYRLAPYYVDRILKGAKPGDLPVQLPKKFTLIVNRKAASALGIDVPLGLLLAADEVIE
jgi:putative tryptophan/tyrosine transport system substrate-binding protein